ncbi:MAG: FMN-binding protein [Acidobacteriota bacterium]|nr:MAG: FMN-binding protein [Acidobacteriota bacterium]
MSSGPPIAQVASPRVWHMYRSMVGVGLLCGVLIVTVFQLTKPIIEHNRADALKRAIFQVLPEARSSTTFQLTADGRFAILEGQPAGQALVYGGYDDQQQLIGVAVEAQGMGYQDVIRVLYGYSFEKDAIVGIRVLESKETPGLGDKIEKDPDFLRNFERLDVSLTEDLTAIAHPIEPVKPGKKQHPWQIDTITGATISSTAIARMLTRSTAHWIPAIRHSLDDFRKEG